MQIKRPDKYICFYHLFEYILFWKYTPYFFLPMIISIGTTSSPKVTWVKEAIETCPYFDHVLDPVEYILEKTESDVSDMPLSLEVTLKWARNRAMNLIKKWINADFYVGIEGEYGCLVQ